MGERTMANDDELEEIRKRKLMELQQQMMYQEMQEAALEQERQMIEQQKKAILRQILTPEARERLARVRMVRPELAEAVELQLILLAEQGRINRMIDDATLKEILKKVQGGKKDFRIEFR